MSKVLHPATDERFKNSRFVFGSNLAGRHGKGAALTAKEHWGAVYGVGVGPTGRAYAIPTKDATLKPLPLYQIKQHVNDFIRYARLNWHLSFFVTAIGTGLAGYAHDEIGPMFKYSPRNCQLPEEWKEYQW